MDTHNKDDSIIRFSVSLQQNLLDELDNRIIKNGYSSRSELVRDMIREKLVEDNWAEDNPNDGSKIAVLVVIYDHHQRELKPAHDRHSACQRDACFMHHAHSYGRA